MHGLRNTYYLNEKDKMNYTAFCGKYNRDCTACLKNDVNSLLPKYIKLISRGVFPCVFMHLWKVKQAYVKQSSLLSFQCPRMLYTWKSALQVCTAAKKTVWRRNGYCITVQDIKNVRERSTCNFSTGILENASLWPVCLK